MIITLLSLIRNTLFFLVTYPILIIASQPEPNNEVIVFVQKAGAIAGVNRACNCDTGVLNQRVKEVIEKLVSRSDERDLMLFLFEEISKQAEQIQKKQLQKQQPLISCEDAKAILKKLPMLQEDYQASVLSKL